MKNGKGSKETPKLEFHFNEEGLFIVGNNLGLSKIAEELLNAAQSEKGYHKHLNFSWKQLLKTKSFIVNFDWIKERTEPNWKNRRQFDVTIIKTERIGKDLWAATKDK
jgi:hypothetical protein